jgi:hypothetical protein
LNDYFLEAEACASMGRSRPNKVKILREKSLKNELLASSIFSKR